MAVANINTEVVAGCVNSITQSMEKIKDYCDKHLVVLNELADQTNIVPIVVLSKSFDNMCKSCKAAAEATAETAEKTRKYCSEADDINSDEGGLFID